MLISSETIKEIAEQLDCGFRAFMHQHTHEMIFIPNVDEMPGIEMDMWEDYMEVLDTHFEDYHEIEKWSSRYAFNIMAEFTALPTLSQKVKNRLIKALNHKGPFRHFKFEIDQLNSERQEWFDFKNKCQEDYVLEQIRMLHPM